MRRYFARMDAFLRKQAAEDSPCAAQLPPLDPALPSKPAKRLQKWVL